MQFLKIAITAEDFIEDEANLIMQVLDGGVDFVHIRKPNATKKDILKLFASIDQKYFSRLKLHDNFEILNEICLGGVHLNSRNSIPPHNALSVSKSLHSIEELKECDKYDYVTLSPIFDSISKTGYLSAFNLDSLKEKIKNKNVIALGGVTPERFDLLQACGFAGGAMLGCVWGDVKKFCRQL
ncbi:MAG: thiamine phosphate synthase [Muribaculaceae bacterium]|nr:thiamine phosphate synthase [Muribaculaceae bacterium]